MIDFVRRVLRISQPTRPNARPNARHPMHTRTIATHQAYARLGEATLASLLTHAPVPRYGDPVVNADPFASGTYAGDLRTPSRTSTPNPSGQSLWPPEDGDRRTRIDAGGDHRTAPASR